MATRAIRIDADVKSYLDAIRAAYGDKNYSDAIRRALRWAQIVQATTSTPDGTTGGGPR